MPKLRMSLLLVALLAGCSSFPLSTDQSDVKAETRASRTPSTIQAEQQSAFTKEEMQALYYYDLGPDQINVSEYPPSFKKTYSLFADRCSRCHTLARPINSPRQSYPAWKYYVFEMRLRSHLKPGTGFTQEEAQEIVDFLTYDSMLRKDMHREQFENTSQKLQRRFDETLAEKMRRLQQGMPVPHRPW